MKKSKTGHDFGKASIAKEQSPNDWNESRSAFRPKKPVALLIYNRPDCTAQVFAEIAKVKPQMLLVASDGPRYDRPSDAEKCAAVREIVTQVR